jgi:hypothetical protein
MVDGAVLHVLHFDCDNRVHTPLFTGFVISVGELGW